VTARLLIVNGDDFGLTPGVNAGIVHAHTRGLLTSASMFPNAPSTEDAVSIARAMPSLGVGCHLTLVDGVPLLAPSRVPTLAPGGVFRPTWGKFIVAAAAGRIALAEVERELEAQIDRLRSTGIALTHLDSHKHVHAYPPIFRIVARLARRFRLSTIRIPYEAPAGRWLVRTASTAGARRQAIENVALGPWCAYDRRLLAAEGLPAPPRFIGRVLTGLFTVDRMVDLVRSVPDGITELMTHPGYVDQALMNIPTRLRDARAAEVDALTDSHVRDAVRSAGISLRAHGTRPRFVEPQSHAS
jgi:hopanoid biosynthesis associated protein HpnK